MRKAETKLPDVRCRGPEKDRRVAISARQVGNDFAGSLRVEQAGVVVGDIVAPPRGLGRIHQRAGSGSIIGAGEHGAVTAHQVEGDRRRIMSIRRLLVELSPVR